METRHMVLLKHWFICSRISIFFLFFLLDASPYSLTLLLGVVGLFMPSLLLLQVSFSSLYFQFYVPRNLIIVLLFLVKHYTTIQWSRMISECINVKVTTEVGQEGEVCGCVLWSWLWCDPNVAGQPDGKHRARERRENTFMLTHSL